MTQNLIPRVCLNVNFRKKNQTQIKYGKNLCMGGDFRGPSR